CMLSDNHDLCVLHFINNVNARTNSKSVKKCSKRKFWKPTGKVFTNIGYIWRPTGRTFTIVGNACPLTRITTTTEVPLRKTTALDNETSKPVVLKSVSANKKEPSQSWGSIVYDVPSSSLDECKSSKLFSIKFRNDHMAKILGYGDYHIGNVIRLGMYDIKLKFEKDHLCSACAMGKSKKKPDKPKFEDTNQEKLYLLHMDLCGPMRVISVNGKKYILVIVDDYSRFTWVKFLRSKDKAPYFIIKFLKMIQKVGISHETSVARSPQQNGVVERRNRTLIKAARTMLIYAKALLFLWAEAVAIACYTKNRSIVRLRYGKTPYEILHDKLPDLSFFHVIGALCYPTNDSDNLVLGPALHEMTPAIISSGLVPNPPPSTPFVPPSRSDWDLLFHRCFDNVENLVQNPRESEDECECDVPDCDDSQTTNFSMFSNPLFDDSTSSDDESSHEERAEEYISLMERLLYDNSSPRPPEDFLANLNTIIESLPTFHFDFIPSHNDLGSDLDVSSPSGDRNKIYDPRICIEVESTRFLSTLSPVIDTLLLFSSENEDKVFNHGVLASKEKSPPSSSHRGFKASKLFHYKSPMLIYGEDIPILDFPIAPDFEASRARGFVPRSLELQSFA
ncbi:retrovirus-related pol polyprotein from transposon TNT 1-94, partial [Tanacetum coccineum]